MDVTELRRIKVELLDEAYELASDPLPDVEGAKARIEDIFQQAGGDDWQGNALRILSKVERNVVHRQ